MSESPSLVTSSVTTPGPAATAGPAAGPGPAAPQAEDELASGLARLRRRGSLVVTERWLMIAGGILLPLGALLVVGGWYGAAHTSRVFEEVPYLISGGLFGLVLVIVGAAFYFGYWLTRIVSTERQMLDVLVRVEQRLATGAGVVPSSDGATHELAAGEVFATKAGTMYHRRDCPVVAERPPAELRKVRLPTNGMTPCKLCAPVA